MTRIAELDGLRAVAVFAVIAFHYTLGTPFANRATGFGWVGVDLFFVLSGYLITSILLASRTRPNYFTNFYARRTLRIFPVYFLLLALYVVAARALGGPQPWSYWGMHAAFLSATVEHFRSWSFAAPAWVYGGVTVLWSLSIEEQFYLFWAPVVRWLRPAGLWLVLAAAVAGAPLLRHVMHTRYYPEYRFLPGRCDSLAFGAILALALQHWQIRPAVLRRGFATAGSMAALALTALLFWTGGQRSNLAFATLGYTVLAVGFTAVVGLTALNAGGPGVLVRCLRWRPAQYLGRISYTVYLVHYPVLLLIGGLVGGIVGRSHGGLIVRDLLSLAAALAVAAASWHWLEAPILHFKDRWVPARGQRPELARRPLRTSEVMAGSETA